MTKEDKEKLELENFRSYTDLKSYRPERERLHGDTERKIMFALSSPGGGVVGEIAMEWTLLGGRLVPKLKSYEDSWKVLYCFTDLLEKLADVDGDNITPEEFIEILESLDFINTESYEGHYIPTKMFESYQRKRKRDKKLDELFFIKL